MCFTSTGPHHRPQLLAEALLGFIDKDKNGVLEGSEVKALLTILGFAPVLLMPIPGFVKIEYKVRTTRGTGGQAHTVVGAEAINALARGVGLLS